MKKSTVRQFGHFRTYRKRPLNDNGTISTISLWDRSVCPTDVKKYMECPAGVASLERQAEQDDGSRVCSNSETLFA